MAGWQLKSGSISEHSLSEDRIWSLFNFVFSDVNRKRNIYKLGFVKTFLDSAFNRQREEQGVYFSYEQLFARFAENY